jgi:hypothetical protein
MISQLREVTMSKNLLRYTCLATVLAGLAGCALPPDVSPNYVRVPVESPEPPGYKYVLVPEACITPDPTANDRLGETLPPGCANYYNLLRMAERKKDLEKGRPLGKASGVKTAKAAQKYLDGKDVEEKDKQKQEVLGNGQDASGSGGAETSEPSSLNPAPAKSKTSR